MNSLYAEVLGCVIAASLLGLFAGWMMQRARASRRLADSVTLWEAKYDKLKSRSGEDSRAFENRLQSLGEELRSLTDEKRELVTIVAQRDARIERARREAIELNRQQASTQERLQRIIRNKDQVLASLGAGTTNEPARASSPASGSGVPTMQGAVGVAANASGHAGAGAVSAGEDVEAYIDRLSDRGKRHRDEARRMGDATVRANEPQGVGTLSNDDSFDATALLDIDTLADDDIVATQLLDPLDPLDATETQTLAFDDHDSTIAFDEETLARVHGRSRD